jgi:methanogenic corrinoid protein MtbC1
MEHEARNSNVRGVDVDRVGALARQVIEMLRKRRSPELQVCISEAALWLADASVSPDTFCKDAVMAEMENRQLRVIDVIDHCIPQAARILGQRWVDNETSFALVSLGSARLLGLCKAMSSQWVPRSYNGNRKTVLIAACQGEDHTIGAAVIADQMRRAGHSVRLMVGGTAQDIASRLRQDRFDLMMLSCGGVESIENVARTVRYVKTAVSNPPKIVLGGAVLGHVDGLLQRTGVDLVTNDLSMALPVGDATETVRRLAAAQI